jgi:hypothetical protein
MNFFITFIGAVVLLVIFYLHYQRRAAAIKALAARLGFSPPEETLPRSLSFVGTGLEAVSSTWNVIEGKSHGIRIVVFDCQIGIGKGSCLRTVIAAQASTDIFGMFNPEFTVERSGDWAIFYRPRTMGRLPSGVMPVAEMEARLSALA